MSLFSGSVADRGDDTKVRKLRHLRVESVAVMFLKCHPRIKDGKEHRYWSVVENRRCGRGQFVQRQVLFYLGEINDSQRESWCRTIEVFDEKRERTLPLALFPADRQLPNFAAGFGVQVRLKEMELHRPQRWGACWLACHLYEQLGLDEFWPGVWPTVERELAGSIFCKPWSAIDSLIRGANGGCIGSGLSRARWEICWMKIIRW